MAIDFRDPLEKGTLFRKGTNIYKFVATYATQTLTPAGNDRAFDEPGLDRFDTDAVMAACDKVFADGRPGEVTTNYMVSAQVWDQEWAEWGPIDTFVKFHDDARQPACTLGVKRLPVVQQRDTGDFKR